MYKYCACGEDISGYKDEDGDLCIICAADKMMVESMKRDCIKQIHGVSLKFGVDMDKALLYIEHLEEEIRHIKEVLRFHKI